MERVCIMAITGLLVWCAGFWLMVAALGSDLPLWGWMVFNSGALFCLGLTFGNFNAIALQDLGHIAGLAAAVLAALTTALSLIIAAIIGLSFDMTVLPMAMGYTFGGLGALALMLWADR
jgi:DHA1 family bicyclomycin/chloramphenicol resistance-like MFS transporter